MIELTKYGLTKIPKVDGNLEVYVTISTPPGVGSKDALEFSLGDEVKIISKDLNTGEWLGISGNSLGKLSSDGLFRF